MEKNKKIRLFLLIGLIFVLITTSFLYVFLIVKENRNVSEMTTTQEETIAIQQRLKDLGYFNAEVTGYYGSITREAVRKFQADYRFSVFSAGGNSYGHGHCKALQRRSLS